MRRCIEDLVFVVGYVRSYLDDEATKRAEELGLNLRDFESVGIPDLDVVIDQAISNALKDAVSKFAVKEPSAIQSNLTRGLSIDGMGALRRLIKDYLSGGQELNAHLSKRGLDLSEQEAIRNM